MKTQLNTILTAACLFAFGSPVFGAPEIRVLPLGDSITAGVLSGDPDFGGYRNRLQNELGNQGYNVDFLGTIQDPSGAPIADKDHQGVSGWRLDQLEAGLPEWANTFPEPDGVLLMAGTNDFSQGASNALALTRMESLIDLIFELMPDTDIFLGYLVPRSDDGNLENLQVAFNQDLNNLVSNLAAEGKRIHLVDTRVGLDASSLNDGVHPNSAGYDQLGLNWFNGITTYLEPTGDTLPPVISSICAGDDLTSIEVIFSKPGCPCNHSLQQLFYQ